MLLSRLCSWSIFNPGGQQLSYAPNLIEISNPETARLSQPILAFAGRILGNKKIEGKELKLCL